MSYIEIGLNSQDITISTYDVYVSNCNPTQWQIVSENIIYSDFPVIVNLDDYSITGTCYQYYVSGDTGCYCSLSGDTSPNPTPTTTVTNTPTTTATNTPTTTTTNTPTPTDVTCVEFKLYWTFDNTSACNGISTGYNKYYSNYPLSAGNVLYDDINCTIPSNTGRYIVLGVGNVLYVGNNGILQSYTC